MRRFTVGRDCCGCEEEEPSVYTCQLTAFNTNWVEVDGSWTFNTGSNTASIGSGGGIALSDTDIDNASSFDISVSATTLNTVDQRIIFDYTDANNFNYAAFYNNGGTRTLAVGKRVSGTDTDVLTLTAATGTLSGCQVSRRYGKTFVRGPSGWSNPGSSNPASENEVTGLPSSSSVKWGVYAADTANFQDFIGYRGESAKIFCESPVRQTCSTDCTNDTYNNSGTVYPVVTIGSGLTDSGCTTCEDLADTWTINDVSQNCDHSEFAINTCGSSNWLMRAKVLSRGGDCYWLLFVILRDAQGLLSGGDRATGVYESDALSSTDIDDAGNYPLTMNLLDSHIKNACGGSFPSTVTLSI